MSCVEVVSTNAFSNIDSAKAVEKAIKSQAERVAASQRPIVHHEAEDEVRFPHLPPLLRGHPDIHLRNGVMRASRLAALHEVDAEKAFFVADLSCVFKQHEKWVQNLPFIEPFYGTF